jgi:hypothetical protein
LDLARPSNVLREILKAGKLHDKPQVSLTM